MNSILKIIDDIASNPSKNAKVDMIRENAENTTFLRVLDAALNPLRSYNIKQVPIVNTHSGNIGLDQFLDHLTRFEYREVTGNDARGELESLLSELSADDAEIAARIIRKNLRAGFSASSVNKAKSGTILEYPCLKATAYSIEAVKKIKYPAYSQIKADGMRANIISRNNKIVIRGRSGKIIDLLGNFDFLSNYETDMVLDGELVLVEPNGNIMPRAKGNGILNNAIGNIGSISESEAAMVHFIGWDYIPLNEFERVEKKASSTSVPYHRRWNAFLDFVNNVNSHKIKAISTQIVNSVEEAVKHYSEARINNEEGIILKTLNHPWENRRSQHLVKFKEILDCDLEIIGWNEGKEGTKLEKKLGSLICASSDRKVIVSISGLTDALREDIFNNINNYIGKIVTIMYNERIKDENRPEIDSLFLPRFCEIREDKDVADDSSAIK